jgi:hypothetical protein
MSRLADARMDARVLGLRGGAGARHRFAFGLLPPSARRASICTARCTPTRAGRHAPTSVCPASPGRADVAMAVVLLVGAGLMIKASAVC